MSFTTSACCAVTLSQQQEHNIHHHQQCADAPVNSGKNTSHNRTVVEDGRVVVKPAPAPLHDDSNPNSENRPETTETSQVQDGELLA